MLTSYFTGVVSPHEIFGWPELLPPQAFTVELTASAARFFAAFKSRSWNIPQILHSHCFVESGSSIKTYPQLEHVLLLGKKRSAITSRVPFLAVLYSN